MAGGAIDEDFRGRKWEVTVHTATEARQAEKEQREPKTEEKRAANNLDDFALLAALDQLDPWPGGELEPGTGGRRTVRYPNAPHGAAPKGC